MVSAVVSHDFQPTPTLPVAALRQLALATATLGNEGRPPMVGAAEIHHVGHCLLFLGTLSVLGLTTAIAMGVAGDAILSTHISHSKPATTHLLHTISSLLSHKCQSVLAKTHYE